jgi:hypothetical protein
VGVDMGWGELGRARPGTSGGRVAVLATLVAVAGSLWVDLLRAHDATTGAVPAAGPASLPDLLGAVSRVLVTLPATLLALRTAVAVGRRLSADPASQVAVLTLLGACGTGAGTIAAGLLVPPVAGSPAVGPGSVLEMLSVLPIVLLLTVVVLGARVSSRAARRRRDARRVATAAVVAVLMGGVPALTTSAGATTPTLAAPGDVCASAVRTVRYDVVAMKLDIPLNGWGDHVPEGVVFALANGDASPNVDDLRAEPGRVTPLVMRAAVGDCLKVTLTNRLDARRVGMHVDGVMKDVSSDGARIGRNEDSTVAPGGTRTYTWFAQRAGQFAVNDYGSGTGFGMTEPSTDTTSHGLYGGLVVLPAGFRWTDPVTGRDLLVRDPDGSSHAVGAPVYADAHGPGVGDDFRDVALMLMDEPEGIVDRTGHLPVSPTTGLPDSSFGFNYRTEPLRNRVRAVLDHEDGRRVTLPNGTVILPGDHFCDGWTSDQTAERNRARLAKDHGVSSCLGEEDHLQSWVFGDPGKLTKTVDEADVLNLDGAAGGTFTLSVTDPTLPSELTGDGTGADAKVDTSVPHFPGEQTRTRPIPYGAGAAEVQRALLDLDVLPMADLVSGDITVSGGPDRYVLAFGQHFAGRDVEVTADAGGLTPPVDAAGTTPTATVGDDPADGGRPGRIVVLSDALLPHAYRGDPVHVRLIHPGVKETHPFHQHTNRWRQESEDPGSTRLDVQSIGPGQTMDLVYEGGAGEAIASDPENLAAGPASMDAWVRAGRPDLAALAVQHSSNGDQIFHCHLYPHFAQGFWGALRVFDRQRPLDPALWPDHTPSTYADGTPLRPLALLPDFDLRATAPDGHQVSLTPLPDEAHPGYPLMVKGEYLQRAYRAPGAVVGDRYGAVELNWRRPGDTVRDVDSDATTDLERAAMLTRRGADGRPHAVPGSFIHDPCPPGVPLREYHPTAIDARIVLNKAGWSDPGGKMYVEAPPSDPRDPTSALETAARIRDRIQSGKVQPEPYNMRARLGECVNMRVTNATNLDNDRTVPLDVHDGDLRDGQVVGGTAFHLPTLMSELSTHVHLVRFDELATDGTSVGWNYVQAPMVGQTYNYRWFVDVALRTVYFHDHQNPNTHQQHGLWAAMNVEPGGSQWTDPRTGSWLAPGYCDGLGLPTPAVRPDASDPACYGVGSVADVRVPDPAAANGYAASFREFTVNYADFVPMVDAAGRPINPPTRSDDYATDQGGMTINYRNEPFPTRVSSASTGLKREPAYVFSSAVHGDPSTPLFRAYPGDPVVFRLIGGAHEEGHNFTLSGHRWLHEPDDPSSNLADSQFVMISEFFNFEVSGARLVKKGTKKDAVEKAREAGETEAGSTLVVPGGAGAPGDYLYGSMPLNDLWNGMWGIFRVPAKRVADLQPLPTNTAPATGKPGEEWPALRPGAVPSAPKSAPSPCPKGTTPRAYQLSIVQQDVVYDRAGDHDPKGVVYVLDSDLDTTGRPKAGTATKPLFLRANEGDCLTLTLTNRLPKDGVALGDGDPLNPVERIGDSGTASVSNLVGNTATSVVPSWPAGSRASIHPSGLVRSYAATADGASVGYNYDTTVAPGSSITSTWYLDSRAIGVVNLADFGNLRTTRHHGAWAGLVVEPKGAVYLDPATQAAVTSGEQAVIRWKDASGAVRSYREFVADLQDGLNLVDRNGRPVQDAAPPDVPTTDPGAEPADPGTEPAGVVGMPDPEDQGEVGVNYRTEPFAGRIGAGGTSGTMADVFSSVVYGDPMTPVFRAYPNDPVMVRILNSQDLPRVHTFGITGHSWRYESYDANSNVVTGQGGLDTGRVFNAGICAGSNSPLDLTTATPTCPSDGRPGDYLYNDRNFFHMLGGGAWGLLRVHSTTQSDLKPLPTR